MSDSLGIRQSRVGTFSDISYKAEVFIDIVPPFPSGKIELYTEKQWGGEVSKAEVTLSQNGYKCNCPAWKSFNLCDHCHIVIGEALDGELFNQFSAMKIDFALELQSVKVPLVSNEDGYVWGMVKLRNRQTRGGKHYSTVKLLHATKSPCKRMPEDERYDSKHLLSSVGILVSDEGIDSIRAMVSTWVATQLRTLTPDAVTSCNGLMCSSGDIKDTMTEKVSILLTGECTKCSMSGLSISSSDSFSSDVPVL